MDREQKGLAILGSTGSIGTSALDVVRRYPERFRVVTLAGGTNMELLKRQAEEFRPELVSVLESDAASKLKRELGIPVKAGAEGAIEAAIHPGVKTVVSAVSGAAGLLPTVAAIRAGKDIALANKETLVLAGPLVMEEVKARGVRLMPVDSEHSAVFQSLLGHRAEDLTRVILTASGGPFLKRRSDSLHSVTPDEALRHPRWNMGRKISIDSATLMNKGLEVIEASFLFGVPAEKISVVIHPESIVHSMVEYADGSVISQMSSPDMRGPIAYALSFPERIEAGLKRLDFSRLMLDFSSPEPGRFPCLALAYAALKEGGTHPAVLNAVDEVAVEMFLKGRLPFTGIPEVIAAALGRYQGRRLSSIEDVIEADRWGREEARSLIEALN
ncbi:MAG: 1-deoxy-D-xylulose-5-phosphate reductoisomerase [Deltaproteobacteria bacterium GWC2_56_8]|nr:MAG: 1-deoxy-D-xylulose-5-phosphate reductoisomerase [Deltaproteobacteria bacterium GWB2_55_19]OGP32719.1 MAG: 1-deoxy-D-xylulose-5-phosphate reductoisomerase [Deltaproteobacteria bacterium GWC2_56_8]HAO93466.1 1-deoxy-D-xylulose-5-phosphate reductoisomerase [Deltaproteobacteria bacterium]